MALEGPVSVAVVSRMPNAKVNTAAFLIMMSMAWWIESPVIDLLSTAVTLGVGKKSARVVWKFAYYLMFWVTLAHVVIVLTPIYPWVTKNVLGLSAEVSEAAHYGLILMVPWAAAIGWRRTLQGTLIRCGETKIIGRGTVMRAIVMLVVCFGLRAITPWPSTFVVGVGLICSVMTESGFIHVVSRRIFARRLPDEAECSLTYLGLAKFHFPLTLTTLVNMVALPIVSAGLARTPNSILSLASYEVCMTALGIFRMLAFCLPEIVIALYRDRQAQKMLARFCYTVGATCSITMLGMALVNADVWFFENVLKTAPDVAAYAHMAFLCSAIVPLLDALHSYARGMLTAAQLTLSRVAGVLVGTGALVGTLAVGVALRWPGPVVAGVSMIASVLSEVVLLGTAWAVAQKRSWGLATDGA